MTKYVRRMGKAGGYGAVDIANARIRASGTVQERTASTGALICKVSRAFVMRNGTK